MGSTPRGPLSKVTSWGSEFSLLQTHRTDPYLGNSTSSGEKYLSLTSIWTTGPVGKGSGLPEIRANRFFTFDTQAFLFFASWISRHFARALARAFFCAGPSPLISNSSWLAAGSGRAPPAENPGDGIATSAAVTTRTVAAAANKLPYLVTFTCMVIV